MNKGRRVPPIIPRGKKRNGDEWTGQREIKKSPSQKRKESFFRNLVVQIYKRTGGPESPFRPQEEKGVFALF